VDGHGIPFGELPPLGYLCFGPDEAGSKQWSAGLRDRREAHRQLAW
jgi:hypothetical protein